MLYCFRTCWHGCGVTQDTRTYPLFPFQFCNPQKSDLRGRRSEHKIIRSLKAFNVAQCFVSQLQFNLIFFSAIIVSKTYEFVRAVNQQPYFFSMYSKSTRYLCLPIPKDNQMKASFISRWEYLFNLQTRMNSLSTFFYSLDCYIACFLWASTTLVDAG